MSSPVSIGDILLIVDGTLTFFSRLKNAPAELTETKRDFAQMRTALEVLRTKLDNEMSFLAKQRKI